MTRQKTFKAGVRSRMSKTGERYTAARRQIIDRPGRAEPEAAAAAPELLTSDDAVRGATGLGWDDWFGLLDEWGATGHSHSQIAGWLVAEHGMAGWWSQSVTVGYERARGMRAKHQVASGFSVGANRTIAASADTASDHFTDRALRDRWLPDANLAQRTGRRGKSARFDWPADGSRVVIAFTPKGPDKTQVSIQHEKLPDAAAAERMKTFWRERLAALKEVFEQ